MLNKATARRLAMPPNQARMKSGLYLLLGLAIFGFVGCDFVWNIGNRGTLKSDLEKLIGITFNDCQMIGTTRTGSCSTPITVDELRSIADKLKLSAVSPEQDPAVPIEHRFKHLIARGGCNLPANAEIRKTFEPRPAELHLGPGTGFEYLLIVRNAATGIACVQASYSYG
jgi:hypothetical protein